MQLRNLFAHLHVKDSIAVGGLRSDERSINDAATGTKCFTPRQSPSPRNSFGHGFDAGRAGSPHTVRGVVGDRQHRGFGENCDGVTVTLDEPTDRKIHGSPFRQDLETMPCATRARQWERFAFRTNKFLKRSLHLRISHGNASISRNRVFPANVPPFVLVPHDEDFAPGALKQSLGSPLPTNRSLKAIVIRIVLPC